MPKSSFFKKSIFKTVNLAGLNSLRRFKNRKSILILTYHSVLPDSERFEQFDYRNCVSSENFDQQIIYLKKKYSVISMDEAVNRINTNTVNKSFAVITFDDGFRNNFKYAFPVLAQNGVPGTFYTATDFMDKENILWTEVVTALILFTKKKQISIQLDEDCVLPLQSNEDKISASIKIRKYLKNKFDAEKNRVLQDLKYQCSDVGSILERDEERYAFMKWQEVREMAEAGMEIGSHTHTHTLLNMVDEQTTYEELDTSKKLIEKHLNRACNHFSYPNGELENFTTAHILQLEALGYHSAVSQVKGVNTNQDNLYKLKRINISSKMSLDVFKTYISGNYNLFK